MKKLSFILITLVAACLSTFAQEYEFGKIEELKGLNKIYIDTKADIRNRERIILEIEKSELNLEVVDSSEAAEIVLEFVGGKKEVLGVIIAPPVQGTNNSVSIPTRRKENTGVGNVFIKGINKNVPRVVMNFESTEDKPGEKKPATKFAKGFIKAYKKANGISDK